MIKILLFTLCLLITLSLPAAAMFPFPVNHFSGEAGPDLLEDVIASTEWDIVPVDAQTQTNLTVSPASGVGQTANDWTLGATTGSSTDDPTFTSGPPDYLLHDGGDFQTLIGANTTFMKNLHKTTGGQAATIGIAFRTPTSFSGEQVFWSTRLESGMGISFFINGAGNLRVRHQGDGGAVTWTLPGLSTSTDNYVLIAFDFTNDATKVTSWINSGTGLDDTDATASTTTTDPDNKMTFGSNTDPANFLVNTTRVYAMNAFNEVLDDTKAALALTNMEERILDFTP